MLKCFSSVDRALKFIILAVYLAAIIATGVDLRKNRSAIIDG